MKPENRGQSIDTGMDISKLVLGLIFSYLPRININPLDLEKRCTKWDPVKGCKISSSERFDQFLFKADPTKIPSGEKHRGDKKLGRAGVDCPSRGLGSRNNSALAGETCWGRSPDPIFHTLSFSERWYPDDEVLRYVWKRLTSVE